MAASPVPLEALLVSHAPGGRHLDTAAAHPDGGVGADDAHHVAAWLLARGFLLSALELHQELLLAGGGTHRVALLSRVFMAEGEEQPRVLGGRADSSAGTAPAETGAGAGAADDTAAAGAAAGAADDTAAAGAAAGASSGPTDLHAVLMSARAALAQAAGDANTASNTDGREAASSSGAASLFRPPMSPFLPGATYSLIAARDARIALLSHRLRCAEEDLARATQALEAHREQSQTTAAALL